MVDSDNKTQDHILNRLDTWYSDRIKRNYTPDVAKEVKIQIATAMRKSRELSDLVSPEFLETYSPVNFLKQSKEFWSKSYADSESFANGNNLGGLDLNSLSQGVREEYVQPLLDTFIEFKGFVDTLREKGKTKKYLSDEDINTTFISYFGNLERYIELSKESAKALPFFMRAFNTGVSKREFEMQIQYTEAILGSMPYIARVILSDLGDAK